MKRFTYQDLAVEIAPLINECFPWDVEEKLEAGADILFLDVRENQEYDTMHIEDSLHVPRGILETAVEWDHEETEPELVQARDKQIVVVCRSGSRSVFAAYTLMQMGYKHVTSLKTGLRGWNEYDLPLVYMEQRLTKAKIIWCFFGVEINQQKQCVSDFCVFVILYLLCVSSEIRHRIQGLEESAITYRIYTKRPF